MPEGACDSHCHVFGPAEKFPYSTASTYIPVDAPKETLFQRHKHLGVDRAVLVQASCHGTDNSAMIDCLETAGGSYRGIAIVSPDVTEKELQRMHEAGVRGVRFNFVKRLKAKQSHDARQAILKKISRLPWHVVVYFEPEDIAGIRDFLLEIPKTVVIDHMGCVSGGSTIEGPEFSSLANLLKDDRFWVKVSCPERLSKIGYPYEDTHGIARELIRMVPDRVLWGTDRPHPNMKIEAPDDGLLVDRIPAICPGEKEQRTLLIDNPYRLYWGV